MRKMYKNKKRSCQLCKPHKRGWVNRWKEKEKTELKRFTRAVAEKNFDEEHDYELTINAPYGLQK